MQLSDLVGRWKADLGAYSRSALFIHTKSETLERLVLNPVQRALHEALEAQRLETGLVRAIVLKARQMGVSTYIAARFFRDLHLASVEAPVRALVMAQDDTTAKVLKRMYAGFWEYHDPALRRPRARSNDHEEEFEHGSYLTVRTASTTTGMRGGTISRLHGSEVAYWPHAEEHTSGAMNQLSKGPGTELILESTARGATGAWYERWRAAVAGASEFIPLFYPWTMLPEYAMPVPHGFGLSHDKPNDLIPSEHDYAAEHHCTLEQMAWRRREVLRSSQDGQDGTLVFAQEYPASPSEAFLSGGEDSFIAPSHVEGARRRDTPLVGYALRLPLIVGCDPAPMHGSSATCIIRRRGNVAYDIERLHGIAPEQLRQRLYDLCIQEGVARLCIDESEGEGHYLVQSLSNQVGLGGRVVGVRFGYPAHDPVHYANRRAEVWDRMRLWMNGATIPDEQTRPGQASLASELLAPKRREDERRLMLTSKEKLVGLHGNSPDGADALAVTFAYPDPSDYAAAVITAPGPFTEPDTQPLPTMGRLRGTQRDPQVVTAPSELW